MAKQGGAETITFQIHRGIKGRHTESTHKNAGLLGFNEIRNFWKALDEGNAMVRKKLLLKYPNSSFTAHDIGWLPEPELGKTGIRNIEFRMKIDSGVRPSDYIDDFLKLYSETSIYPNWINDSVRPSEHIFYYPLGKDKVVGLPDLKRKKNERNIDISRADIHDKLDAKRPRIASPKQSPTSIEKRKKIGNRTTMRQRYGLLRGVPNPNDIYRVKQLPPRNNMTRRKKSF